MSWLLVALAQTGTLLLVQAGLVVLFILLSGLFSAAEASLISTPAYYRRHLVERAPSEDDVDERLGSPNRVFVTVLVGNYLANSAAAILLASLFLGVLPTPLWASLLVAIVSALLLLLVLGELMPRALATVDPDRTARWVTGWIVLIQRVLGPVIWVFERVSSAALQLFGAPTRRRVFLDEDELKHMIEVGQEQGIIEAEEREMISRVIDFADEDVGDVMVPRTDIIALETDTPLDETAATVIESGHSRIPVYEDDLDQIVGVVYGKDVLDSVLANVKATAGDLMKEALFVPETAPLDETLREMKTRRIHIAIVHDEFGGTAGLISLEDVLEEIVGDIFDEYDPETQSIEWVDEDIAILDARMDIDEVNDALDTSLPEEEGYETLGGYLFHEFGRPGSAGEQLDRDGYTFTLERVANRRILKVRAEPTTTESEE